MPDEDVPKREIPEHIPKPDYATEGTELFSSNHIVQHEELTSLIYSR